ncbi:uncharacterized protein LOC123429451 isoform X1 [Hordeum vulgare subsp. vulgare]|uniref:uncharacterized protein LOC123429451 isoform X1 n=1 Tax=Hordeum vulgare subsp. vulgare TaxID=112509 RepID=UPI001B85547B|nr:uncharacterized protein LOC123429451 isoform X1 [Hordeum vulgare subsp. vulgare]
MMTSGSISDAFNESHVSNHERRLNELNYRVREVNLPQMECINVIKQIKTEASNRDKLKHFTMNSRAEEPDDLRSHEGSGDETGSEDGEDDTEQGDETESEDGEEDEHEQEEEVRHEHQQTHEIVEKTRRGPTHMRRFWKEHDVDNKINLKFNRFGQPCGLKTCKLSNFIGTLVKGKEISLAAQNWSKVPKLEKEKLWDSVQAFFNIDESYKRWVLRSASKKWKDFKVVLKRKYYKADLSWARNILNGCDNRIPIGQWEWLVKHWRTDKAKEKSERNKATRASQIEGCNGTHISFAVVLDQMEMVEGREIGRAELYVVTHTKNDGYPVNQQSGVKMDDIKKRIRADPSLIGEEARDGDLYSSIFPKEKKGRPSGLGLLVGGVASERLAQVEAELHAAKQENVELRHVVHTLVANQV